MKETIIAILISVVISTSLVSGIIYFNDSDSGLNIGAPSQGNVFRTIIPETDSTFNLGASGNEWANLFVDVVTVNSTLDVSGLSTLTAKYHK